MKRFYLWLTISILAWPLAALILDLLRFGSLTAVAWSDAFAFLGMGLLSGGGLLWTMQRSPNHVIRTSALVGYLVLCPFAFSGALLSGLNWSVPFLGTAVYGGLPLLVGTAVGYFLGYRVTEE